MPRLSPIAFAFALAFAAVPLHAQNAAAALAGAPLQFDIAARPLGQALNEWALRTGLQVVVQPALVNGRIAPPLAGRHTAQGALDLLLRGSGLVARADGAIVIVEEAASGAAEKTMPGITVSAEPYGDGRTEHTGSYTAAGPARTATGLALSLRETPQSVTVMTRQRMDDFNLRTLAEVLEQTPGVTLDTQGDANNFTVRGSSVNMQIDGVRQMASGWATNAQKLYSQDDMVEIDRIEVLKGSAGLVSGDGAYGGLINLVRKRPTREFQASATAGAGRWDAYRLEADIGGPLDAAGTVRGRIVAAAADSRGYRDYVKKNNQTLFGTVEVDLAPDTLLTAGITLRHREYYGAGDTSMIQAYAANGQFLGIQPRSFNVGAPWSGYEQESTSAFARLEHRFGAGWTAKLSASSDRVETPHSETGIWWTVIPQAVDLAWGRDYVNRNRAVAIDVTGPFQLFGRTHELLVGADTMRTSANSYSGSARMTTLGLDYAAGGGAIAMPDLDAFPMDNHSRFSSKRTSLYAAGRFALADPVKLIAGARVTDYEQLDVTPYSSSNNDMERKGVVTPYAGLVADVHRNVSLYGSYARIFRVQSAQDAGGHMLPPEEGQTRELGAKGEFFDRRLNASIARFWMKTDNTAQSTGQARPDGMTIYRALSGVTRHGYELELSGELAPGWQAQGSYVVNSSTLSDANTSPKKQFKLASTYRFTGAGSALRGLTVGAAARWQSDISAGVLRQPSFWVADLMARWQVNGHLSILANVGNAFDKAYFSGMRDFGRLQYTWGSPRSWNVSARYDF